MDKSAMWIKSNPFWLLRVSCSDSRRAIMAAVEEMSFLYDVDICTEAQNALLNPAKRLSAEWDWFTDSDEQTIQQIVEHIDEGKTIFVESLAPLSKLNSGLYNFSIASGVDAFELGYALVEIDEMFCAIDPEQLTRTINQNRDEARLAMVSLHDVAAEQTGKRERIRRIINARLEGMDENEYVFFVTILAEKHFTNGGSDHIIISDVIDQYALRMSSKIETATEEILCHIEELRATSEVAAVEGSVDKLIEEVRAWDALVQPLQIRSMVSGMPHNDSQKVGRELRELGVYLHNELGLTKVAQKLVWAMKELFSELAELAEKLLEDEKALDEILKDADVREALDMQMRALRKFAEEVKRITTEDDLNVLIDKIRQLNARIRASGMRVGTKEQMREELFYLAREVVLELHNKKQQTERALKLAKVLELEFSGLSSLQGKQHEDVSILNQQLFNKQMASVTAPQKRAAELPLGCSVWIGLIVLIFLIGGLLSSCTGGPGSSSTTKYTPKQTYAVVFTQSAESGEEVYADITSIEPVYSVGIEGTYAYTDVACKCRTSAETIVWVYMSIDEYNTYIDSNASLSSLYADFKTINYSPAKRIRGEARKTDVLCEGLSAKIGDMVLKFESIK